MRTIAIVEDSTDDVEHLKECLQKYGAENGEMFNIFTFKDGVDFLDGYKSIYDLVFMDIDLPMMNGMRTSEKLRSLDAEVVLIFTTNLAQFAIKGYDVNAVDFIVKPYSYEVFRHKLSRALKTLREKAEERLFLKVDGGIRVLRRNDILYVEIIGHNLYYHTESDVISCRGSLAKVMQQPFFKEGFAQCNKCYLVNLSLIEKIEGYNVYIGKDVVRISRPKKVIFMQELARYYADKGKQ